MTDLHLIIPPVELVDKWVDEYNRARDKHHNLVIYIAGEASKWSADAELEACKQVILDQEWFGWPEPRLAQLHNARRPKPPSKAESALNALEHILRHSQTDHGANTIRLALEQLKKLEALDD